MICDECGKSNVSDLSECSYCGAKMPKETACNGFADILSYNGTVGDVAETKNVSEGIKDEDMQKLLRKSDNIIKTTRKNSLFGLIAVLLSAIVLICSVVTLCSVKKYKKETETKIDSLIKMIEGEKSDDKKDTKSTGAKDNEEDKENAKDLIVTAEKETDEAKTATKDALAEANAVKAQIEEAEAPLEDAEEKIESVEKKVTTADRKVNNAKKAIDAAEEKVDDADGGKKALDDVKGEYKEIADDLNEAKGILEELKKPVSIA